MNFKRDLRQTDNKYNNVEVNKNTSIIEMHKYQSHVTTTVFTVKEWDNMFSVRNNIYYIYTIYI